MPDDVLFYINGARFSRRDGTLFSSLARFLRHELRLVGTKISCDEGACGSCTVLVGVPDGPNLRYRPVNSCLLSLFQIAGCHVVTVEGVAKKDGTLSPVQQSLMDSHGAQCGFCTPGMVMTLTQFRHDSRPASEIPDALSGNLCRCTGYVPIVEAARQLPPLASFSLDALFPDAEIAQILTASRQTSKEIATDEKQVYLAANFDDALTWKKQNPDAVIVSGATELGVKWNRSGEKPSKQLCLAWLAAEIDASETELKIDASATELKIDATATWTQIERETRDVFPELSEWLTTRFAGPQIKNVGTLGGQIAHASPLGDALPILLILDARLQISSATQTREIGIDEFLDAPKLDADEILRSVIVKLPQKNQKVQFEKVTKRRAFDRSLVSAAMLVAEENGKILDAKLAFNGLENRALRAPQTEQFLTGKLFTEETLTQAGEILRNEIGAQDEYAKLVASNLLLRLLDDENGEEK